MSGPLKNEDFRKLMMTPRVGGDVSKRTSTEGAPSFTHRRPGGGGGGAHDGNKSTKAQKAEKYKKKAAANAAGGGGAKKKKEPDEDSLASIMKGYRDRAKERRVGEQEVDADKEMEMVKLQGGYNAVPSTIGRFDDTADDRRQTAIEESKYLGGDMEHTHLVKGLDYALLQKVRSELTDKEQEEDTLEALYTKELKGDKVEVATTIKSMMVRNLHQLLFVDDKTKTESIKPSALFAPRRMAYIMNVTTGGTNEEEAHEDQTDIPTTLIRSKADCPIEETASSAAINDAVILKLSQVLGYLRADPVKHKKKHAKETPIDSKKPAGSAAEFRVPAPKGKQTDLDIYEDIGEYKPSSKRSSDKDRSKSSRSSSSRYFDEERGRGGRREEEERRVDRRRRDEGERQRSSRRDERSRDRPSNKEKKPDDRLSRGWAPADIAREKERTSDAAPKPSPKPVVEKPQKPKPSLAMEEDSYMECYPSGIDRLARMADSDEEADYNAMDKRSKGPTRFDFDTDEQYAEFQSKKEANPKAAYQFGVKTADGRKTRKGATTGGGGGAAKEKDGKQKLDKQWDQISKILAKRKEGEETGATKAKMPKY